MGDWREQAIEAAVTAAIAAYVPAGDEAVKDAERLMRLDMEKGIDAAAPLIRADEREKRATAIEALDSGWTQYQRMPENTTHICYVHENGEVYDPERGWLPKGESLLLDHADPLVSRDTAARIARGESDG